MELLEDLAVPLGLANRPSIFFRRRFPQHCDSLTAAFQGLHTTLDHQRHSKYPGRRCSGSALLK